NKGFVQGNFDQSLLFMDESDFKKAVTAFLEPMKEMNPRQRAGWVCGLGHGVLPKTPEKNVRYFVDTVRKELS
ncbi:MAG: uroporphyrinogen decarboxylase family protein, partial [Bdellovibrio sp.]